jgi:TonB family protein
MLECWNDSFIPGTPAERIELVWPLTVKALSLSKRYDAKQRLQRHIARVFRREGLVLPHRRLCRGGPWRSLISFKLSTEGIYFMRRFGEQLCLIGMCSLLLCKPYPVFGWIETMQNHKAAQNSISGSEIKAPRREPIRIGGDESEDHRRHIVYPVYPEKAKREHIEGRVRLTLTVNEEGFVSDVAGDPGNNPVLELSAIAAVKKWRYGPWLLMGEPIPVLKVVTISFVWKDRNDVHVWLDDSGPSCEMEQILKAKGEVWIEARAPYWLVEDLYHILTQKGLQRVHWPGYRIFRNQLFLSISMIEKAGPSFEISDIDRVNKLALASGKFGKESSQSLRYELYFDRSLAFIGLERLEGPEIPEVETALQRIRPKYLFPLDCPIAIYVYLPIPDRLKAIFQTPE